MHAPCVPTSKSRRWTDRVITVITIIVYYERIEIKIVPGAHWITPIHLVYAWIYVRTSVPTWYLRLRRLFLTTYAGRALSKLSRRESLFFYFSPIAHRLLRLTRIFNYNDIYLETIVYSIIRNDMSRMRQWQ